MYFFQGSMSNNEKTEAMQPLTVSEPPSHNNLTFQTVETKNKRNTCLTVEKNIKNKLKKDSNSESTLPVQTSENVKSFIPRDEQNGIVFFHIYKIVSKSPESGFAKCLFFYNTKSFNNI